MASEAISYKSAIDLLGISDHTNAEHYINVLEKVLSPCCKLRFLDITTK